MMAQNVELNEFESFKSSCKPASISALFLRLTTLEMHSENLLRAMFILQESGSLDCKLY